MEATKGEVTGHALKLEEELEHSKRVQGETADRLVSRSADVESVTRSLASILLYVFSALPTQENLYFKSLYIFGCLKSVLTPMSVCLSYWFYCTLKDSSPTFKSLRK